MKKFLCLITYYLSLITCGGEAVAEKLCLLAPGSFAYNPNLSYTSAGATGGTAYYGWAVGTGCGDTSKTGALTGFCTNTQAAGIAACAIPTSWPCYGGVTHDNTNGYLCFCKMTYPKTGVWVLLYAFYYDGAPNPAWCRSSCANDCGSSVRSYDVFRAAVLASATP